MIDHMSLPINRVKLGLLIVIAAFILATYAFFTRTNPYVFAIFFHMLLVGIIVAPIEPSNFVH